MVVPFTEIPDRKHAGVGTQIAAHDFCKWLVGEIILLSDAVIDLDQGREFYDKLQMGVGDYFYDSLISDIESLYLYAGIHPCHDGYH